MRDFLAQVGKLLRFEFRKLFRRKTLYFAVAITFFTSLAFVATMVEELISDVEDATIILSNITFGQVLATSFSYLYGISMATLCFLGAIIVGLVFCEDYSTGTIKLIVGRGYEKTARYTAKAIIVLFCSIIMGVVAPFIGMFIGTAAYGLNLSFDGFGKAIVDAGSLAANNLFASMAMFFATIIVFMLIGVLVKKSGAAIAICIGATYVLQIVIVIAEVIMQLNGVEDEVITKTISTAANTFPMLYTSYVSSAALLFADTASGAPVGTYVGAAVWIVLGAALGLLVAHKRDC